MVIKSETMSFTVPKTLRLELGAIPETGYYDSTSEFLRDAMRTILAARKDLRVAIATVLYKKGKISLGKAVEIADVNYEEMKKILYEKGIKRKSGAETKKELYEGLRGFEEWRKKKHS
ncbi:MAG: UPF0175 family protein [Nanoarchaeota archaeon]|nr:UPF0175 family protein [Nanoarchaeota archaeon]